MVSWQSDLKKTIIAPMAPPAGITLPDLEALLAREEHMAVALPVPVAA